MLTINTTATNNNNNNNSNNITNFILAITSHVEYMKYQINKDLFMYLKVKRTFSL